MSGETLEAFWKRARNSIAARRSKYSWQAFETLKKAEQFCSKGSPKGTIFIFGCQRSGTTHLERLFRADPRSKVFGEFSELSVSSDRTLWMAYEDMRKRLDQSGSTYVVIRSLLASHRVVETLRKWPDASAFWVFRDANSVVDSMIRKWGGNFFEISKKVESSPEGDWELLDLWSTIHKDVRTLAPKTTDENYIRDVYALYWLYRNQLAIDLHLARHPRIVLGDYSQITQHPTTFLNYGLSLAGIEPSRWRYKLETRTPSLESAARKPRFSPEIQLRCDALYKVLQSTAEPKNKEMLSL